MDLLQLHCVPCQEKIKKDKTGAVIRAILSHDFGTCSQVDLTDMQSSSHQKQYHWIIVYQCPLINVCVVG